MASLKSVFISVHWVYFPSSGAVYFSNGAVRLFALFQAKCLSCPPETPVTGKTGTVSKSQCGKVFQFFFHLNTNDPFSGLVSFYFHAGETRQTPCKSIRNCRLHVHFCSFSNLHITAPNEEQQIHFTLILDEDFNPDLLDPESRAFARKSDLIETTVTFSNIHRALIFCWNFQRVMPASFYLCDGHSIV